MNDLRTAIYDLITSYYMKEAYQRYFSAPDADARLETLRQAADRMVMAWEANGSQYFYVEKPSIARVGIPLVVFHVSYVMMQIDWLGPSAMSAAIKEAQDWSNEQVCSFYFEHGIHSPDEFVRFLEEFEPLQKASDKKPSKEDVWMREGTVNCIGTWSYENGTETYDYDF